MIDTLIINLIPTLYVLIGGLFAFSLCYAYIRNERGESSYLEYYVDNIWTFVPVIVVMMFLWPLLLCVLIGCGIVYMVFLTFKMGVEIYDSWENRR